MNFVFQMMISLGFNSFSSCVSYDLARFGFDLARFGFRLMLVSVSTQTH